MKKNMKAILPMLVLATATTAFANGNNVPVANTELVNMETSTTVMSPSGIGVGVTIDNEPVANSENIIENEHVLFPVRVVFEALGFEVGYDSDSGMVTLIKGAQYVTFVPKEDAYSFARMAHQPLGTPPVVQNGVTYVPVELLEMMEIDYMVNRSLINIFLESTTELEGDDLINSLVNFEQTEVEAIPAELGEVDFGINSLVNFEQTDVEAIPAELGEVDFGVNSLVNFEQRPEEAIPADLYADLEELAEDVNIIAYSNVEVVEVDFDRLAVSVQDPELGLVELVFEESEGTLNALQKLAMGHSLAVEYGDRMTMSIPMQNSPKSIKITELLSVVEVLELETNEETNETRVTVISEEQGEVVLNLHDELEVDFSELEVGQVLAVQFGDIMTMSIPPMNNPKSVEIITGDFPSTSLTELYVGSELGLTSVGYGTSNYALQLLNQPVDGELTISLLDVDGTTMTQALNRVVVKSVNEDGQVLVEDANLGEVLLNTEFSVDEIAVGDILLVEYSPMMTRSIPPMNTPNTLLKQAE